MTLRCICAKLTSAGLSPWSSKRTVFTPSSLTSSIICTLRWRCSQRSPSLTSLVDVVSPFRLSPCPSAVMGQVLSECLGVLPRTHYDGCDRAPRLGCRDEDDSMPSSPRSPLSPCASLPPSPAACQGAHSNLRHRQHSLADVGGSVLLSSLRADSSGTISVPGKTRPNETEIKSRPLKKVDASLVGVALPTPVLPSSPHTTAIYDLVDEEDVCFTCLEAYSDANPRVMPTCGHDFHLQCVLAWAERSATRQCPVCSRALDFEGCEALMA
jgi:RING-H2 zinc finger domain